jgi:hypothetical protein
VELELLIKVMLVAVAVALVQNEVEQAVVVPEVLAEIP